MLSEEAFSAFWSEAPHLHKWPLLCILQPSSPKLREFRTIVNARGARWRLAKARGTAQSVPLAVIGIEPRRLLHLRAVSSALLTRNDSMGNPRGGFSSTLRPSLCRSRSPLAGV